MNICQLDQLKNLIQSSHINFLFGAGLSCPYLKPLGPIEKFITETMDLEDSDFWKKEVNGNLLEHYFKGVMEPCLPEEVSEERTKEKETVIECYKDFLRLLNYTIAYRNTSILDKQINIFTTNIDNFVELAAEDTGVEFNDGFKGHLNPIFSEDSFSKILTRVSPLYHTPAVIPVFNYLKIHGSITWKITQDGRLGYDSDLCTIRKISYTLRDSEDTLISLYKNDEMRSEKTFEEYVEDVKSAKHYCPVNFMDEYENLVMINPRKAKFRESVIDNHFYELMRLYSNSLEKPNTVLFVAGFSFADEHIAKITLRAANSNPTLQIIVFAYDHVAKSNIQKCLLGSKVAINNNITIIAPKEFKVAQGLDADIQKEYADLKNFDLGSINKFVFSKIKVKI